jgi:hypothetical protein
VVLTWMRRVVWTTAIAGSLVALAGGRAASGESVVVATSPSPMGVGAYRGRVVWGELGEGGWQLKTFQDGAPVDLPISRFAGDNRLYLDVGPREDGSPALVYSRCEHTAEGGVIGCDVFRYDFDSQIETPVRSINTPGAIETSPSIRGNRIAFTRRVPGRSRPALYVARTRGAGRAKRVAGGRVPGVAFVKGVALSRRGLLFVGLRSGGRSREQVLYRIWRGRRTVLERRRYGRLSQAGNIGPPHVDGDNVYFSTTLPHGRFGARTVLVRVNLRSRKRSIAKPPAPFVREGGVASIVRFRHDFLLETYAANPGPGLSDGNCFPAPASERCTLRRVSRLAFRTTTR